MRTEFDAFENEKKRNKMDEASMVRQASCELIKAMLREELDSLTASLDVLSAQLCSLAESIEHDTSDLNETLLAVQKADWFRQPPYIQAAIDAGGLRK